MELERLNWLKQDHIILGQTTDSKWNVINHKSQVEFEPSDYYIEDWSIHRYTKEELENL